MRKLLWFTLGFGGACAFCAYGRLPVLWILPVLAMLAAYLTGGSRLHKVVLTVLGIVLGLFWFSRFENRTLQPMYALDGVTKTLEIRCSSYPEKTDYGLRAEGRLLLVENNYPVVLYLDGTEAVEPGTVLSGPFRFQVTAPGGQKESTYYQGEGIYLLAYQKDELTVSLQPRTVRDIPAELRQGILRTLEKLLPGDTAPFAKALLLGDSSDLDYETVTDFTVSGIRHIVAVSGLHVSILFTLLSIVSFRKRFLSALLAFPTLFLFAAVTGFTPSVSRACIMSGLMLLASLVGQEYDGPSALSFAGLILLLWNPLVIVSVSYQLSFASVAGIFLFSPGIRRWLQSWFDLRKAGPWKRGLVRWFTLSVSVTLGATTATVPLCAYYFGTVSLAAVVTNLLVLWAVSLIFYGLIGVCLLSLLWEAGAWLLGQLLSLQIRYVLLTAKIIANFPLSAVYTRSPYIVAWLVFVYVLLAVFLLSRKKKPLTFLCCTVLGLCLALLASWGEPLLDDVRFTVLDVGQGQCLLLQSHGKTYMIDCGGSTDAIAADMAAETLLSQGISKVDGLILTHYDRDHAGGVPNLLTRMKVNLLVLPPVYSDLSLDAAQILYASDDLILTSGETEIHIFASQIPGNDNESSLCILFDTPNCDILITGDRDGFGERSLLRNAHIPDVDVLVAGHHGSKHATCEELLTAVRPEIVCISAGRNNLFGHPAADLLQRLADFGCSVYRTDLHGDITIRR